MMQHQHQEKQQTIGQIVSQSPPESTKQKGQTTILEPTTGPEELN